ncbi:hypothetical protein Hanom_Chr06g00516131 [Helianthus anomalus]
MVMMLRFFMLVKPHNYGYMKGILGICTNIIILSQLRNGCLLMNRPWYWNNLLPDCRIWNLFPNLKAHIKNLLLVVFWVKAGAQVLRYKPGLLLDWKAQLKCGMLMDSCYSWALNQLHQAQIRWNFSGWGSGNKWRSKAHHPGGHPSCFTRFFKKETEKKKRRSKPKHHQYTLSLFVTLLT